MDSTVERACVETRSPAVTRRPKRPKRRLSSELNNTVASFLAGDDLVEKYGCRRGRTYTAPPTPMDSDSDISTAGSQLRRLTILLQRGRNDRNRRIGSPEPTEDDLNSNQQEAKDRSRPAVIQRMQLSTSLTATTEEEDEGIQEALKSPTIRTELSQKLDTLVAARKTECRDIQRKSRYQTHPIAESRAIEQTENKAKTKDSNGFCPLRLDPKVSECLIESETDSLVDSKEPKDVPENYPEDMENINIKKVSKKSKPGASLSDPLMKQPHDRLQVSELQTVVNISELSLESKVSNFDTAVTKCFSDQAVQASEHLITAALSGESSLYQSEESLNPQSSLGTGSSGILTSSCSSQTFAAQRQDAAADSSGICCGQSEETDEAAEGAGSPSTLHGSRDSISDDSTATETVDSDTNVRNRERRPGVVMPFPTITEDVENLKPDAHSVDEDNNIELRLEVPKTRDIPRSSALSRQQSLPARRARTTVDRSQTFSSRDSSREDVRPSSSLGSPGSRSSLNLSSLSRGERCAFCSDDENEELEAPCPTGSCHLLAHTRCVPTAPAPCPLCGGELTTSLISPARAGKKVKKGLRKNIALEIQAKEKEYVEVLKFLFDKYYRELKTREIVPESELGVIFFNVQVLQMQHTIFLERLQQKLCAWDDETTLIGDMFVHTFSRPSMVDTYVNYVRNYKEHALNRIEQYSSRANFRSFCEQMYRIKRETLKSLMTKPAFKIPRYELLLRRLLESTSETHPDAVELDNALRVITDLALKINYTQKSSGTRAGHVPDQIRRLLELDGQDSLYIRNDVVSLKGRRDQCRIWLFSDVIVVSTFKRKTDPDHTSPLLLISREMRQDFVQVVPHKILIRIGLDLVEVTTPPSDETKKPDGKDKLREDLQTLNHIKDLCTKLHESSKMMMESVREQTNRTQARLDEIITNQLQKSELSQVLITANTCEGTRKFLVSFGSGASRQEWESSLKDAKHQLAIQGVRRPDFYKSMQVAKSRPGMQFSCASPTSMLTLSPTRRLWVCNSDTVAGHLCIIDLLPEPEVSEQAPVPGCYSKILCQAAVPAGEASKRGRSCSKRKPSQHFLLSTASQSVSSSDSDSAEPTAPSSTTSPTFLSVEHYCRDDSPFTATASERELPNDVATSVWLGTQDGCLHILSEDEPISSQRHKLKQQLTSPVNCMSYVDNRVYVGLASGELHMYMRDSAGNWELGSPGRQSIGSCQTPVTCLVPVAGKLWCAAGNCLYVLTLGRLTIERSFRVCVDDAPVQALAGAAAGFAVWVAVKGSHVLRLYHAATCEFLTQVSIYEAVEERLKGCHQVVQLHKLHCLEIVCLLMCKDLLWVGTTAGVVVTVPTPQITSTTSSVQAPCVNGLLNGHVGPVRFLTAVDWPDLPRSTDNKEPRRTSRRASVSPTPSTKMIVISGGDGHELYRVNEPQRNSNNLDEGKDDSTNFLLMWIV